VPIKLIQYQSAAQGGTWGGFMRAGEDRSFFKLPESCAMCDSAPLRRFLGKCGTYATVAPYPPWVMGVLCRACGWWQLKGNYENSFDVYTCQFTGELAEYEIGDASVPLDIAARHLSTRYEDVRAIDPHKFSEFIGRIFREHFDCKVELTKRTRDGGKDLVCFGSDKGKFYVEVKNPRTAGKKIDLAIVQRFVGVLYQDKVNRGIIVSSSSYTRDAKVVGQKLVNSKDIIELELRDRDDILAWLDVIRSKVSEDIEIARIMRFSPWGHAELIFTMT